mmetsp:Transcript_21541/g.41823  ORF Transcript_21541/g.41823 Transcript_21541/m.41823 type:complete len:198 (+) Transcript_21541:344-937(+)
MPGDSFAGWQSNIEYMGPACAGFTETQAGNMTEYACGAMGIDCFTAMKSDAYAGFTKECVGNWRDNELGGSVTAKDLAKMSPSAVAGLNDHDVSSWGVECAGFRKSQLQGMSDEACVALTPDCLGSISNKTCSGFLESKSVTCQGIYSMCGPNAAPSGVLSSMTFPIIMLVGLGFVPKIGYKHARKIFLKTKYDTLP